MDIIVNNIVFVENVYFVGVILQLAVQNGFAEDCFKVADGVPVYNGTIDVTSSGILCQRWDVIVPHKPLFPMGPEHENYCRSPDNDTLLWCYTINVTVEWDYCAIPPCAVPTQVTTELTSTDSVSTTEVTTDSRYTIKTTTETTVKTDSISTTRERTSTSEPPTRTVTVANVPSSLVPSVAPSVATSATNTCLCACDNRTKFWINFFQSNLTEEEKNAILEQEKERLKDILSVDKTELTSYVRAHTSARDNRPSAVTFGVVGVVILSIVFGSIVALDAVTYCPKMIRRSKNAVEKIT